jgi:hypothetical protein
MTDRNDFLAWVKTTLLQAYALVGDMAYYRRP